MALTVQQWHPVVGAFIAAMTESKRVVRHTVVASCAMQIGYRHEVIHKVKRQAVLEQSLLCKEVHVPGLRTGQVIDLADVRLRIS